MERSVVLTRSQVMRQTKNSLTTTPPTTVNDRREQKIRDTRCWLARTALKAGRGVLAFSSSRPGPFALLHNEMVKI